MKETDLKGKTREPAKTVALRCGFNNVGILWILMEKCSVKKIELDCRRQILGLLASIWSLMHSVTKENSPADSC